MIRNNPIKLFLALVLLIISQITLAEEKVTVFAAASLTNALTDISTQYEKEKVANNFFDQIIKNLIK